MKRIYFIPGILGSKLENAKTKEVVWSLDVDRMTRTFVNYPRILDEGELVATEVIRSASLRPLLPKDRDIYGKALDFLSSIPNTLVIPFAYDWRESADASAQSLIARLKKDHRESDEVYLIGHSMGGLVATLAVERGQAESLPRVTKVITIGTPFKGAAKAFRVLQNGDPDIDPWLNGLVWFLRQLKRGDLSPSRLREVLGAFQSIYEMMPSKDQRFLRYNGEQLHAFDDKIRWPAKAAPALDLARRVHADLKNDSNGSLYTIYSCRSATEKKYHLDEDCLIEMTEWENDGDGTVSMGSAQGDVESSRRFALETRASHDKLPGTEEVHGHLSRLLLQF